MSSIDLETYKRLILAKQRDLGIVNREELAIEERPTEDFGLSVNAANMELTIHRINFHFKTARELEAALRRIQTGEYGICGDCEEPINPKRLNATPEATRCISCQYAHDNQSESADETLEEAFA